jgi:hypothetical protein
MRERSGARSRFQSHVLSQIPGPPTVLPFELRTDERARSVLGERRQAAGADFDISGDSKSARAAAMARSTPVLMLCSTSKSAKATTICNAIRMVRPGLRAMPAHRKEAYLVVSEDRAPGALRGSRARTERDVDWFYNIFPCALVLAI